MGSDDFCVKVRKIESCDSVSGARRVNCGSVRACSSAYDVIKAVDAIEALSSHKIVPAKFLKCENQVSKFDLGDISKNFVDGIGNSACQLIPEEFQSSWKAGKVSKINFTSSKRARASQINGFSGTTPIDDFKDPFNKSLKRSISLVEKNDLIRQRSVICDTQVERKVAKLVPKNKQDVTIMTSSSTSFTIASGGNNVLGLYGLKSNVHGITQLVGDLSLKEMLESTFECPISSNKKMKDVVNSNDSIMHSLRKACSLLQPREPTKPQNLADSDSFTENKMPTDILGPISMDEGGGDGDTGDPASTELSSAIKNHDNRETPERQTSSLDLRFYQPKELWDKLELMIPTDLDALLLDGSKPSTPSRSLSTLRSGKQVSQRGCLPPFAWSHAFNGISRSNSDAAKLHASRMPCQARWVRIANTYGLSANSSDCYSDLDSIRYNKDLVPSVEGACAMPLSKITSPESPVAPKQEGIMSSFASCPPASNDHCTDTDRHYPSLLAAARTLYGISTLSPRGNPVHLLKWSREFARKLPINPEMSKCSKRPEEDFVVTTSVLKDRARNHEQTPSSKKPRISNIQLSFRKTSTSWSGPRSSRSSQSLSVRESGTSISKQQPSEVSPASRVLDRAIDSQKRPKRSIPLLWGRRGDGLRRHAIGQL